jgi:hypothetical protein
MLFAASASAGVSLKPIVRPHGGPHGGTLVTVERAALEFLYDCSTGKVTAYVLDAHGKPVPARQDTVRIHVTLADVDGNPVSGSASTFTMDLHPEPAAANALRVPASAFSGTSSTLQGVCRFIGSVEALSAGEALLRDIAFRYPGP